MNKINFKIKGMNCNSCAQLIARELKDVPGVVEAKVDFSSKTGSVMYDKTKVEKQDIFNAVQKSGEYQVEEGEDEPSQEKESIKGQQEERAEGAQEEQSPATIISASSGSNKSFTKGLLIGGGAVFLILNVFFKVSYGQATSQAKIDSSNSNLPQEQQAQNVPQAQPINEAQAIQNFTIAKDDHIRGNPNANITLVEFSDFECPFCERQYKTLKQLLKEYPQDIRLVYRHFPLGFHQNAQKAAEASECASEQGKFWEYHDKLFDNQNSYSVANFKKWAGDLGLNTSQFNSCLDSGKYTQRVQRDAQEGQQAGVDGTPATFINGQLISGALPYETFKQAVESLK